MAGLRRRSSSSFHLHLGGSIAQISSQLILVFDNQTAIHPSILGSDRCSVVFNAHGEYDFGSYKRGLEHSRTKWPAGKSTHVLFCNDSVYGPLSDLATAIKPMLQQDDEAWGLTEVTSSGLTCRASFCCSDVPSFKNPGFGTFSTPFNHNPTAKR